MIPHMNILYQKIMCNVRMNEIFELFEKVTHQNIQKNRINAFYKPGNDLITF